MQNVPKYRSTYKNNLTYINVTNYFMPNFMYIDFLFYFFFWEIQQQQNHRLRTDSSLSHRGGGGSLNAIDTTKRKIFELVPIIIETIDINNICAHFKILTKKLESYVKQMGKSLRSLNRRVI